MIDDVKYIAYIIKDYIEGTPVDNYNNVIDQLNLLINVYNDMEICTASNTEFHIYRGDPGFREMLNSMPRYCLNNGYFFYKHDLNVEEIEYQLFLQMITDFICSPEIPSINSSDSILHFVTIKKWVSFKELVIICTHQLRLNKGRLRILRLVLYFLNMFQSVSLLTLVFYTYYFFSKILKYNVIELHDLLQLCIVLGINILAIVLLLC